MGMFATYALPWEFSPTVLLACILSAVGYSRGLRRLRSSGERVSPESLLAEVPSATLLEESNVLINPRYRGASRLKPTKLRRWTYDLRLT
jgi:hypothetical protein